MAIAPPRGRGLRASCRCPGSRPLSRRRGAPAPASRLDAVSSRMDARLDAASARTDAKLERELRLMSWRVILARLTLVSLAVAAPHL